MARHYSMRNLAIALAGIGLMAGNSLFAATIDPSTLQKGAENVLTYTMPDGNVLTYQVYVPASYSPTAKLPLYLWMHGGGTVTSVDTGYSALHMLNINPDWSPTKYPCIIFEPMCAPGWCTQKAQPTFNGQCWDGYGWANGTPAHVHDLNNPPYAIKLVLSFIPILEKALGADSLRCYALGWSNGGYAVWDLLMLRPDLFAAGVAISGAGDTSHASRFVNIPVWAFHSGDDDVVPFSGTQAMIDKLTALGGTPKLTNTNGWKHFAYAPAFQTADLLPWLFSKSKAGTSVAHSSRSGSYGRAVPAIHLVGERGIVVGKSGEHSIVFYDVKGELISRGSVGADGKIRMTELSRSTRVQ